MRVPGAALLFFAATCAQAAGLNKCADGDGRLTYTSQTCEKEGLKSAGPIRDRVTILPTSTPAHRHEPSKKDEAQHLPTVKPISPALDHPVDSLVKQN